MNALNVSWQHVARACAILLVALLAISAIASPDEPVSSSPSSQHDVAVESNHAADEHAVASVIAERPAVTQWFIAIIVDVGIVTITLGIVLLLLRMLRGPHLADRVLAADALSLHVVGLVVLLALRLGTEVFFDAALVVAIIGFASSLAFAQYIGNRRRMNTA